jgi:aryl-alcohol dehydrogenase-like predicted oxidoreductase
MRYVPLGDLTISVLSLGCGNFGGVGSLPELFGRGDDERAAGVVLDAAVEHGITVLDTANTYGGGRSEEWIGRWLVSRGIRDQLVITSKVGNPVTPDDKGLSDKHIRAQVAQSLRRLGTEWIDLYLAHLADPLTPLEETLATFDSLVRAGTIRAYGLSNFDAVQINDAVDIAERAGLHPPVNNQLGHSVLAPAPADTLDACVKRGVGVTAFSPLAGGWLARDYRPGEPYPADSRMTLRPGPYAEIERMAAAGVIDALRAEAARRELSLPTMGLAWVLSDPAVVGAVIGARTPDQFGPALAALDVELTETDRAAIAAPVIEES